MAVQELIEIIIKAQDNASDTARKVDDQMKKIGDTATRTGQKTAQASQLSQQQMNNLSHKIADVVASTNQVGAKGASQFKRYNNSIQSSIVAFNRLDDETQNMLNYLSQMSEKGREAFLGMSTKAQEAVAKFHEMENATTGWGNTLDITKTKMSLMGTDVDSLKGKIQVVGNAIGTHLGNKWDSLKSKVSSFGSFIVSNLTSALSRVRSALDTLGSAFSGLGGIISSAIGMVGMSSITDMTVGLAMNRERMTALTSATMGSAEAGKEFVGVMDNLTNTSLVSLDDLGQAMSTIKMSTGMTNDQLKAFTTTVNDVGQRAILMGKSGDEAMALMQAAGRGLNGEFDMLKSNFGITKEKLEELGWSGAADDVEGYQKALDKALEAGGSMNGMMDTSVGHIETLKKNFRIAGRHVGEMFTPYIDQAVQKLNSLNDTCPGLFENLVMIAGGVSMFATAAPTISPMLSAFDSLSDKGGKVVKFFRESEVISGFWTALSSGEGILAAITAGYDAMAISEYIALGPLLAIIAALAILAVAVYEVGKYFGWWDDVGSMLQAIWAGVQRLWAAFINHPDVQAAIQAISIAFGILCDWIGQAWNAILEFFNISQGGEFDAVHAIIMFIGAAWQAMTGHIRLVIQIVQALWNAFNGLYNDTLQPFGAWLMEVLAPVWETLGNIWTAVGEQVTGLMELFTQFQEGQIEFGDLAIGVVTALWNTWTIFTANLFNLLLTLAGQLLTYGVQAGFNFLNGIGLYLSQLAMNVYNYLNATYSRIKAQLSAWVNTARQRANQLVTGIITYLATLPGRALSQLLRVVNSIVSAGQQWVSNAKQKAKEIVDGVYNTLSSLPGRISDALSGVVEAIVGPFRDAYNQAKEYWDQISSLGGAAGGEGVAGGERVAGGEITSENINTAFQGKYDVRNAVGWQHGGKISVESSNRIILDLVNVPSHIDTNTLIKMLKEPEVAKSIANNRDFQAVDSKVKLEIQKRANRARGV